MMKIVLYDKTIVVHVTYDTKKKIIALRIKKMNEKTQYFSEKNPLLYIQTYITRLNVC